METMQDRERTAEEVTLESEGDDLAQPLPEVIAAAHEGRVGSVQDEIDATEWFMESDVPTEEETAPTVLKVNVGTVEKPKRITWKIVPLPDAEFRKFRQASMPRAARRDPRQMGNIDDAKYHALVVVAASVDPNFREIAQRKGVADPADVLRHRLAHKPGLIAGISGYVSDISGFDDADLEVAAGNS